MKKNYLYINSSMDGSADLFDAKVVENVLGLHKGELSFSAADNSWTKPAEFCASIETKGNGVHITIGDMDISLDYSDIEIIGILYDMYNRNMKPHGTDKLSVFKGEPC